MQNLGRFLQLQTLIANISGTNLQDIQNGKYMIKNDSSFPPAFGERSPVNCGPLTTVESRACEFGPTQMDFFRRLHFGPWWLWPLKISTRARD